MADVYFKTAFAKVDDDSLLRALQASRGWVRDRKKMLALCRGLASDF